MERFNDDVPRPGADTPERACFFLHLRPDLLDEYLAFHTEVWPDVLEALQRSGWRNYSLFLHREDALVVGYCESDDFDAAVAAMEAEPVSARWEAAAQRFFRPAEGAAPGGRQRDRTRLEHYFHLA